MSLNLRWRVSIGFTLLGGVLSLLFAAAAMYITEDYEHVLVEEILRGQAEDYGERLSGDAVPPLPKTRRLSGYLRAANGRTDAPTWIAELPPGIHESEDEALEGIHVGVFDTVQGRLYFVIDLNHIERLERHLLIFLVAVVALGTAVSGLLGWWFAGTTIAPVRSLAHAVEALPSEPRYTTLASTMAVDELGRLAQAIDGYQARLVEADAAEQAFFADASHELRTPVAVVRGAAEVLSEQEDLDESTLQRVHRIDRAVGELSELIEVLMRLVRRDIGAATMLDAAEFLRDGAGPIIASVDSKQLKLSIQADETITLPLRDGLLIVRGVVRRLLPPAPVGLLTMTVMDDSIEIVYQPDAKLKNVSLRAASSRGDLGLGLSLIGRLANRIGWRVEELIAESGGRAARILLYSSGNPRP